GLQTVDGVPFFFSHGAGQAMDVSASLRGVADPFKNKANFFQESTVNANGRVVLAAPGDQYAALHLIAFSAGRADQVPRGTGRAGARSGGGRCGAACGAAGWRSWKTPSLKCRGWPTARGRARQSSQAGR